MRTIRGSLTCLTVVGLALCATPGCALKKMALGTVASSLSSSGDTFASDSDPELVRSAVPFSLKLVESLLVELPKHRGLLLTACSGFTQYAYAFVDSDSDYVKDDDYTRFTRLSDRSRGMYLRARDYCLRSLELKYEGIGAQLSKDADAGAARVGKADVALLYWTGASWGKAVSISLDQPALVGDLPTVRALFRRALQLDESFQRGALHEAMISLESVPEAMGGSPERARRHFERAVALSGGTSAGPYLTYARSVLLSEQKREEFVEMLKRALNVDVNREPSMRLANLLAQEQARFLLGRVDRLFISDPVVGGGDRRR